MIIMRIFQKRMASITSAFLMVYMITSTALATTYYVSSSIGNDEGAGTEEAPWKTSIIDGSPWRGLSCLIFRGAAFFS